MSTDSLRLLIVLNTFFPFTSENVYLHVEGALVELGDRVVGIKDGHLLVHLADDEPGQGHPRDGAHQLHRGPVVDVAVTHSELLRL